MNIKESDIEQNINFLIMGINPILANDYGESAIETFRQVAKMIKKIYRNINFKKHKSIIVFKDENYNLKNICDNVKQISDFSSLSKIGYSEMIVQVQSSDQILVSPCNEKFRLEDILKESFVYEYTKHRDESIKEVLHTKSKKFKIPESADSESIFATRTFKELDEAISYYKCDRARYAKCPMLKAAMDTNRIFFKAQPESLLRDSLYDFLCQRLRGECIDIQTEQIVDSSHPVDIKVTWKYTNNAAILEIKWLGKSINSNGKFTKYYENRAKDGAKQLKNYLEQCKIYTSNNVTFGYLIVFDLRRRNTNINTKEISKKFGFWYKNSEIEYNTEYCKRDDFMSPIRIFIEPRCEDAS